MGSSSRFRGLIVTVATAALVLAGMTGTADAAKKKKKKPAPATVTTAPSTPATNEGEIDAPPAAGTPAAPPPASPPPAPASSPTTEPTSAAAEPGEDSRPARAAATTRAQGPTSLGRKHTLVVDDLSGFRASSIGGVAYSGPIGFSAQSFSETVAAPNGSNGGTDTFHFTTFWFAPSADYFVIDHLSIGALVEIAATSGNYDQTLFSTTTTNTKLPTTTDITILPRVGWLVPLGEHWGIWPRIGLGYGSHSAASAAAAAGGGATSNADTYSTFILDLDVGVLYRMNQTWFLRAGPELTFGPGSHSIQNGNTTTTLGASLVSFSVAGGFGFMWNL